MPQHSSNLGTLPPEILVHIANVSSLRDLRSLRLSCKELLTACMMVWVQVDRRENGYSTNIYHALNASQYPDPKVRLAAINVIKRDMKNGARIDEDIPAMIPWFFHKLPLPVTKDFQDAGVGKIESYLRVRNLFLFGLCFNDETILTTLLDGGLPRSIQTSKIPLCVLASAPSQTPESVTVASANTDVRHSRTTNLIKPSFENSSSQVEEIPSTPWSSRNQRLPGVRMLWTDTSITGLLARSFTDCSGGYTNGGTTIDDRILHCATQQTLVHKIRQDLDSFASTKGYGIDNATRPDIPLTTLSILLCHSCGWASVIGWFDWVVEGGTLTEGTVPEEWSMEYILCLECKKANRRIDDFDEDHVQDMVDEWLGDFTKGPSDWTDPDFGGKALFSWCENHFQLLSMSLEEGLKPLEKEEFLTETAFFRQWFKAGGTTCYIEISSPHKDGLPDVLL